MWAWETITASSGFGSYGGGGQVVCLSSLEPWKTPQSRRTRCDPDSSRNFEPVTVPQAPRNRSVAIARGIIRGGRAKSNRKRAKRYATGWLGICSGVHLGGEEMAKETPFDRARDFVEEKIEQTKEVLGD